MGSVRPFKKEDLPGLVKLYEDVQRGGDRSLSADHESYFRELLFENPWHDPDLPSLLYEEGGEAIGFLGVVPRPMSIRGRPILAAVSNHFIVKQEKRSTLAGLALLQAFFSGYQDLSLAEGNPLSRKVWEGVGGKTSILQSIHWSCPLRPGRFVVNQLTRAGRLGPLAHLARPLTAVWDSLAARAPGSPFQRKRPAITAEVLDVKALCSFIEDHSARHALRPVYDERSLGWLLSFLHRKKTYGDLVQVLLRAEGGRAIGWYLYYSQPGGVSQVLQVGARVDSRSEVLDHLLHHAWANGAVALSGRFEPQFLSELSQKSCLLSRHYPWMLIHSAQADVLDAICRGDAFFTRLEGEWWIPFHQHGIHHRGPAVALPERKLAIVPNG